jgi:hypothetical protein
MQKFLKILEEYGSVDQNANQYELTLKITDSFLHIPDEYLDEFPICRQEWKIRITVLENSFEIETSDQELSGLSKDEQKETRELLSKFARGSKIVCDGSRISIKGPNQDNAFKEGIGRIVQVVREYNKLLGHQIIGYIAHYTIDCHCGSRLQYSKFQFRCTNPHCNFAASLKEINDCLNLFLHSDLDCSAISRKGEIAYYLKRTDVKDAYNVVKITDAERKNG